MNMMQAHKAEVQNSGDDFVQKFRKFEQGQLVKMLVYHDQHNMIINSDRRSEATTTAFLTNVLFSCYSTVPNSSSYGEMAQAAAGSIMVRSH